MSLTDIVSGLDRSLFTQVALLLFFAAFASIIIRLFRPGRRGSEGAIASLPLDEAPVHSTER